MSSPPDTNIDSRIKTLREKDDAWLRALHAEAWRQYMHEDNLTQQRTNIFQVVPVVLLAFLGAASAGLVKVGCACVAGHTIILGIVLIGVIFALVSILMLLLARAFDRVTEAGRLHVNLRHMNARALERLAGVGVFGPTTTFPSSPSTQTCQAVRIRDLAASLICLTLFDSGGLSSR